VHPNRIGKVAKRFPDVPIIMDHMGYPEATEEAIRVAEECPNVYLGTTILRFFKPPEEANPTAVADAVRRVGADRVVWGSNLPEYPHSALWCRQAIERLKLGAEAEALIFGETLTRIYKITW
jgi:predicted TIM-barrel fold metal-dependent hydrolase